MSDRQSFLYSGHKLSSGGANDPLLPRLIQAINHATEIEISVSFSHPVWIYCLILCLMLCKVVLR
ncbi:hypothetical protein [Vibrio cholerae]|uniref:hypothetical protein n=1 Tax=Vibrio cholerae TaxID=666 RepID=UPI003531EC1F